MSKKPDTQLGHGGTSIASDGGIDFSDIAATTEQDWKDAVRGRFHQPGKRVLVAYLDTDLVAWLEHNGANYQERLNCLLRRAMENDAATVAK